MRIGVDVDGVIADLLTEWLARYNSDTGEKLTWRDVSDWRLEQVVKPEYAKLVYSYLGIQNLYDDVKPVPDALWGVTRLVELGHEIVFVTSVARGAADSLGSKLRWMRNHGFAGLGDIVTISSARGRPDKSIVRLDLLIDDYHGNLDDVASCGTQGILFRWHTAYNQHVTSYPVAHGWHEVVQQVELIQKGQRP